MKKRDVMAEKRVTEDGIVCRIDEDGDVEIDVGDRSVIYLTPADIAAMAKAQSDFRFAEEG